MCKKSLIKKNNTLRHILLSAMNCSGNLRYTGECNKKSNLDMAMTMITWISTENVNKPTRWWQLPRKGKTRTFIGKEERERKRKIICTTCWTEYWRHSAHTHARVWIFAVLPYNISNKSIEESVRASASWWNWRLWAHRLAVQRYNMCSVHAYAHTTAHTSIACCTSRHKLFQKTKRNNAIYER